MLVASSRGEPKLIPSHRKHYHFTLIEAGNVVQGIMFRRLDRQAGTSFYWVRLEIGDEEDNTDRRQYRALREYLEAGH